MQTHAQGNNTIEHHKVEGSDRWSMTTKGYQRITRKYFPILAQLEEVQEFRSTKADILSAAQIIVLKTALSPEKLAKSGFLQLCQGFEILNKAERLELGKSSENVAHSIFGSVNLQLPTDNK